MALSIEAVILIITFLVPELVCLIEGFTRKIEHAAVLSKFLNEMAQILKYIGIILILFKDLVDTSSEYAQPYLILIAFVLILPALFQLGFCYQIYREKEYQKKLI